jgi:2-aminoadipate transaminase
MVHGRHAPEVASHVPTVALARRLRLSMTVDPRIDRLQRRSVENPGVLSLAGGLPAEETFPLEGLARSLRNAGTRALQYDWPEGRAELRARIAARLARRGAPVDAGDIIVTNGAQQAIDIAIRLVTEEGDEISVPAECYPAALELFRARGLHLVVGPHPESRLAYAMPVVANPTGAALDGSERDALLGKSRFVVEDDAYAELAFDGGCDSPLFPSAPDRVAHVGTFSKTLCPGLRVGWLVVPPAYRDAARRAKQLMDLQSNGLAQCMIERFLALEDFDRHLEMLRGYYACRAAALAEAVRQELPSFRFREPRGGFSLWVTTDLPGDDAELLATALAHGVSFDPGGDFRPNGAATPLAMRLSFSSLPIPSMQEAVRRLARAVAAYANRHAACRSGPHVHPPNLSQEATEGRQQAASSNDDHATAQADPAEERSGRAPPAAAPGRSAPRE